ncbi:peroxiredoxin [Advenella kashmirensis W13003]|uniref:Peroxiredoxin n=1 Tax=Advenella kashmirensis W13003 TaxID=1424334 RepID=V8QUM6_9BURK|nr:OsmC family protein [Advenella kashmirensis]ETF02714.1 peroxiredoxin [Advenella kashmirensis W13003]
MAVTHDYEITIEWTGNRGDGTLNYKSYDRDHVIQAAGKPDVAGSADAAFRGDPQRWSPEDLLVASVSACHKLWYLHLCADAGIQVLSYVDHAHGVMQTHAQGGAFTHILLKPTITVSREQDVAMAMNLHHDAHEKCFIANSVNFPIEIEPEISATATR